MGQKTSILTKSQIILFAALLLVVFPQDANAIGVTIDTDTKTNLTGTTTISNDPNIAISGNNIYVAYVDTDSGDGTTDVYFTRSTNSGTSFETPYIIDSGDTLDEAVETSSGNLGAVQIEASGNNVYVVWEENDPDNDDTDIYIAVNTSSGASGSWTITNLSNSIASQGTGSSTTPQLSVSGANVYVVWRDDANSETNIYINRSDDSGATFEGETKLTTASGSNSPDVASTGDSVFVVWHDTASSGDPIAFRGSNDKGVTFAAMQELSVDDDGIDTKDDVAIEVSGTTAHVVWVEEDPDDIHYRPITDNQDGSFTPGTAVTVRDGSTTISGTLLVLGDSTIHVAWRETDGSDIEVYYSRSTDSGASFSTRTNISDDTVSSRDPQIEITDDELYISWWVTDTGRDVFVKASVDDGANFGAVQTVQNHANEAKFQKMASASGKLYIVWEDDSDNAGANEDIFFVVGDTTNIEVAFAASNYRLSETATINVTAPDSNSNSSEQETITVSVTSDATGSSAISITATETTVSSGIFSGTITFSRLASDDSTDAIKAVPSTIITATFSSQTGQTSIYSRTVNILASEYNLDGIARISVTDQNSNTDSDTAETIEVIATSSRAIKTGSNPVAITLTETGVDTGEFGGASDAQLRFMNGFDAIPLRGQITIFQEDSTKDTTASPDTTTVTVTTDTETDGTTITLTETGNETDLFEGILEFTSGESSGNQKKASAGDFFTVSGVFDLKGQIEISEASSKKAMRINADDNNDDTLTVTFGASSDTATVKFRNDEDGQGGGGGGLVRPTVVLNAVLGAASKGIDFSPPSVSIDEVVQRANVDVPQHIKDILNEFDPKKPIKPLTNEEFDLPLKINDNGYALGSDENTIETETITIGEPVRFEMVFYDDSEVQHASMYLNIRDNQGPHDSDTQIVYDVGRPVEIIDKNSFFEDVSVEFIEEEDGKNIVIFEMTFTKDMPKSDLIYKSWDRTKRTAQVTVYDAIEVPPIENDTQIEEVVEEVIEEPQEVVEIEEKKLVPTWVKANAKWWSEGGIDDNTFTEGIGFLISEQIIDVPVEANVSEIDNPNIKFEVKDEEEEGIKVPGWVKTNAEWWANDQIDEETFLSGIGYLVKHGVIKVT